MKNPSPEKLHSLESRLVRYGVAAGASVAAGALPQTADAAIVLFDPADVTSGNPGYVWWDMEANRTESYAFAEADFKVGKAFGYAYVAASYAALNGINQFVSNDVGLQSYPLKLAYNDPVSTNPNDFNGANYGILSDDGPNEQWPAGGASGYLGLKFQIGGQDHFGWAEITVNADHTVTLMRWAYEDQANTAITAGAVPEPAETALAMLLGAAGVAGFREYRKRKGVQPTC